MSTYPRDIQLAEASPRLRSLIQELTRLMLDGPMEQHSILRDQVQAGYISHITLTGAGHYAYFGHDAPRPIAPSAAIGGDVHIDVQGLDAPAGCLLKVEDGKLAFLEIYTFGEVPWPDDPIVLDLGDATPLPITATAT